MTKIAIVAHNVSSPLYRHRSKEFSERVYFMAKQYDEVHVLSKERNLQDKTLTSRDELYNNVVIHKIHNGFISSNIDVLKTTISTGASAVFADGIIHGRSCLLCKRFGIPLVTFVQGFEADLKAIEIKRRLRLNPDPGFLSAILEAPDSIVLRSSDRILCVSNELVGYAQKLLHKSKDSNIEKIVFIPHSLKYVTYMSETANEWAEKIVYSLSKKHGPGLALLMTNGVGPAKGTDIALKTLKDIISKYPAAVMLLIGKTFDQKYAKLIKELGLDNNVLFLVNLPRERVLSLLTKCSVFLLPSLSEGFSLSIHEAIALGIPVVSYNSKPLRSASTESVITTVNSLDPKIYAKQCISILHDKTIRQKLSNCSKQYIAPYTSLSEQERNKLICLQLDSCLQNRNS